MAHDELDTKAFEFVFSLTIVVWLLDLSKILPNMYEAIGWLITLAMVILFCVTAQSIKKVNTMINTDENKPYITIQDEKYSGYTDKNLFIGFFCLTFFFILVFFTNNWYLNDYKNVDNSFCAKFLVLSFGWFISGSMDSLIYNINKKPFESEV